MAMLEPKLAVLDETDSGLDIDALRVVSQGVTLCVLLKKFILLLTARLLDHIVQTSFTCFQRKIIKSGGRS